MAWTGRAKAKSKMKRTPVWRITSALGHRLRVRSGRKEEVLAAFALGLRKRLFGPRQELRRGFALAEGGEAGAEADVQTLLGLRQKTREAFFGPGHVRVRKQKDK